MINIMIADNHRLFCEGLKCLLETNNSINVSCIANSISEILEGLRSSIVDLILLDIDIDDRNGLEILELIQKKNIPVKTIVLTNCSDINYVVKANELGVHGYLLKDITSSILINAVDEVYKGNRYIQSELIPAINIYLINQNSDLEKLKLLTSRELEILKMVTIGGKNIDIANKLNITERTVKNHLSHIFDKLEVTDRTQAVVFAIKNNLVGI